MPSGRSRSPTTAAAARAGQPRSACERHPRSPRATRARRHVRGAPPQLGSPSPKTNGTTALASNQTARITAPATTSKSRRTRRTCTAQNRSAERPPSRPAHRRRLRRLQLVRILRCEGLARTLLRAAWLALLPWRLCIFTSSTARRPPRTRRHPAGGARARRARRLGHRTPRRRMHRRRAFTLTPAHARARAGENERVSTSTARPRERERVQR